MPSVHACGEPKVQVQTVKHIAYAINTGHRENRVFIDNEPGPVFDSVVNGPFFTPDGNHFAYLA